MKCRSKEVILLIVLLLFVVIMAIGLIISFNDKEPDSSKSSVLNDKDILLYIDEVKQENEALELVYENSDEAYFKSLVYLENERFKTFLIDTKTGDEITFSDLILEDKIDTFSLKEEELLNLKYPEFIVKSILENSTSTGYKSYFVKDNEVIIYYYDYVYSYNYSEIPTLTINYQEIKECLKFNPQEEEYTNEDGYNFDANKKSVALTFDDGPSSVYNSLILEELKKNKAHATFFMVGRMMNACNKCVVDTYNSGNEVASHTYEHMNIKKNSLAKVNTSLNKVNELYNSLTGDNIKYLRPPYGAYSKTNLENATIPFILWNLDTEDWRYRNVDHIVNYIMDNVSDGSIILMHELYETSYESLKIVLPRLYAMGYQVVNISELFQLKGRTAEIGKAYRSLK
ncbi:MAG: polysaccharide deacetylase family protein [Ruminococcus sp.]|nr:polysaccharide deacetylase family protein [Ruminococcus sp.]